MLPIKDTIPNSKKPVMTWVLIFLSLGIFIFQNSLPLSEIRLLIIQFGFIPGEFTFFINNNLVFTENFLLVLVSLFSYTFLHGSWSHLIFNLWSLWIFGDNVEDVFGRIGFLAFYLLGGAAAAMMHFIFNPVSVIPVIGASGSIAAVMGAYMLMYPYSRILTLVPVFFLPLFFRIPAVIFMGVWFFMQVGLGLANIGMPDIGSGVAWWAHAGGFIFGVLVVVIFRKRLRVPNYSEMFYSEKQQEF